MKDMPMQNTILLMKAVNFAVQKHIDHRRKGKQQEPYFNHLSEVALILAEAERKRLQIEHTSHLSERAKMIKIADKISDLKSILQSPPTNWTGERKVEYFEWSKKVVAGYRGGSVCIIIDRLFFIASPVFLKHQTGKQSRSPFSIGM